MSAGESAPGCLEVVLVDLAGTLVEPEPGVAEQYRETARELVPPRLIPPAPTIRRRFRAAFARLEPPAGELRYGTTRSEGFWFWKRVVSAVFVNLPDDSLQSLTEALFDRFGRADAWRVLPGAVPCLEELGERDVRRGLISNWDVRGRRLFASMGLHGLFEVLGFSFEEGMEKPDGRFFDRVLARLGNPDPARGLMVGNSAWRDLDPARERGFRTCWMRGPKNDSPHPGVGSWTELSGRLKEFPSSFERP